MPLLRTMARTTVIAGTATAVSGAVSRKQQGKYAAQQQQAKQAPAVPAAVPSPASPADDPMDKLKNLGALHAQGILTDEEFAAEKSKILNA